RFGPSISIPRGVDSRNQCEDLGLQKTGKPALVIAKNAHTGPWPPPRRVRNIMSAIMLRRRGIQPRCPTRVSTARPALVGRAGTCLEVTEKSKQPVPGRSCLATGISHNKIIILYFNFF